MAACNSPRVKALFPARLSSALLPALLALACSKERTAATTAVTSASVVAAPSLPTSGCGKPPGKAGERRLRVGERTGLMTISLPRAYDPQRRYPLGFAFHGRNRDHVDCQRIDCAGVQSVMGERAVLVYLRSLREPDSSRESGWEWPTERDDNTRFFEAAWAQVESELCIDSQRVFLTGTSSGGAFANWLGCLHGEKLLAIAPVSGGWPAPSTCPGAPAALVIHGIDDPHVPPERGSLARDSYRERSRCAADMQPALDALHAKVRKARDASPSVETVECVDYRGCAERSPLRWCEHSYGGYDGSTHGWPPVGGQLVWDFVSKL